MATTKSGSIIFDTFDQATLDLSFFGSGLGPGGDFNGDGFTDLLISAEFDALGERDNGTVFVVYGSANGFDARVDLADPNAWDGFRIDGMAGDTLAKGNSEPASLSVADVNDDGIDDILLGVPRHGFNDEGRGYVIFGSSTMAPMLDLGAFTTSDGIAIGGTFQSTLLGWRFENLGDTDGDGLDNIGLNSQFNAANVLGTENSSSGVTLVFDDLQDASTLSVGEEFFDLTTDPDGAGPQNAPAEGTYYTGINRNERAGGDLAALGDFNGDGIGDFVIGSENASTTLGGTARNFAGAAHVVLGGSAAATGDQISLSGGSTSGLIYYFGPSIGSDFGARVAGAGDVNGDGFDDLLVTSPLERDANFNSGAAYLIYGGASPAAVNDMSLAGTYTRIAEFGTRNPLAGDHDVTGVGDVNGDGFDDILISTVGVKANDVGGTSGADGVAWLLFGGAQGLGASFDLSTVDGTNGFVIGSNATTATKPFALGSGASALGDINGDGFADFALSANRDETFAQGSQGAVFVFHGGPSLGLLDAFDGTADGFIGAENLGVEFGTANGPPTTGPVDLGTVGENDGVQTFDLANFVTDPEGDPFRIDALTILPNGASFTGTVLTLDPNGLADDRGLTIGQTDMLSFRFEATDDLGNASGPFNVSFDLAGADDPSQVSDLTFQVLAGGTVGLDVLPGISDIDGQPSFLGAAALGETFPDTDGFDLPGVLVFNAGGGLEYIADDPGALNLPGTTPTVASGTFAALGAGDTRTVSFTYFGGSLEDQISGAPLPSGTVTIEVTGQNGAPVAGPIDLGTVNEDDGVLTFDLSQFVTDPDGDAFRIDALSILPNGVSFTGTTLRIDPNVLADDRGLTFGQTDGLSFRFNATDDFGNASAEFTASFELAGVDDPAQVADLSFTMVEGDTLFFDAATGISDVDGMPMFVGVAPLGSMPVGADAPLLNTFDLPGTLGLTGGSGLAYVAGDLPSQGQGGFSPTPGGTPIIASGAFGALAEGDTRTIEFSYFGGSVQDFLSPALLPGGTISIEVIGQNDNPVAGPVDLGTVREDAGAQSIDLTQFVTDPDGDPISISAVNPLPAGFGFDGTRLTFDPNALADARGLTVGQSELITLSFEAEDGLGGFSGAFDVSFVLEGIDDPTVVNDLSFSIMEGDTLFIDVLPGLDDVDGMPMLLGVSDIGDSIPDFDGFGIEGVLGFSGNGLAYAAVDPSQINLPPNSPIAASGVFAPLAAGETRLIEFTYFGGSPEEAGPGAILPSGTISIEVTGQNAAPVVGPVNLGSFREDDGLQFASTNGVVFDPDGTLPNLRALDPLPVGVTFSGRTFVIDPDLVADDRGLGFGQTETISMEFEATDNLGASSGPFTVSFDVTGVDDPTVVNDLTFSMLEGETLTIDVLAGLNDVDGMPMFAGVSALGDLAPDFDGFGIQGVLGLSTNSLGYIADSPGNLNLAPGSPIAASGDFANLAAGDTRLIEFAYYGTTSVGAALGGPIPSGTISIEVTGVNDAPVVGPVNLGSFQEDGGLQFASTNGVVFDPDGTLPNLRALDPLPAGVSFSGRTFVIDPDVVADDRGLGFGQTETITMEFEATDNLGANSGPFTVSFDVTGVDDPTVVNDLTFSMLEGETLLIDPLSGMSDVDSAPIFVGVSALGDVMPDTDGFALPGVLAFSGTGGLGFVAGDPSDQSLGATTPIAASGAFTDLAAGEMRSVSFNYYGAGPGGSFQSGTITIDITGVDNAPAGPNLVLGTSGSDYLVGTSGADAIVSREGRYDRMLGGADADQFVFGAEANNGRRERDVIVDYEVGVDSIVLSPSVSVASIRETSSQVVVFLDGDRDAIYVRGNGVTASNLDIVTSDAFDFV